MENIHHRKMWMKKRILDEMFKYISYMYQALEGSSYITTKSVKDRVFIAYHDLMNSWYFKAPLTITLEKEQVIKLEDYTNIVNIRKGYSVTDKADGIRNLLILIASENQEKLPESQKTCEFYLINRQNDVKTLGITAPHSFAGTLIDGELITKNISGQSIQKYMIFDIYFVKGENIMAQNLKQRIGGPGETGALQPLIMDLKMKLKKETSNTFDIGVKTFYYAEKSETEIFAHCKTILTKNDAKAYPYHIDGLIFTPIEEGVWGKGYPADNKLRWTHSFKWKPPSENTVDFLVNIEKDDKGNDRIYSYKDGKQIVQYKKCILFVGYDDKQHSNFNSFRKVNENPKYNSGYNPIKFMPYSPYQENAYTTLIPITGNQLLTQEGTYIRDNLIVEFSYSTVDERTKWIPLRIRHSKGPNALNTVLNVWSSIHNPVTADMISSGKDLEEGTNKYYIRQKKRDRTELSTYRLQDFHNRYVKYKLLERVTKDNDTLLDIAVGKGGDLHKWTNLKLSFVLGQDISQDGLIDPVNGACVRYLSLIRDKRVYPNVFFVWGDSSQRISTGDSALDKLNKYYLDVLYGNIGREMVLNKHLHKFWGIAKEKFNVVSAQFAIHYFFKDSDTFKGFLKNIEDNVKPNGHFIGTCLDGSTLFSKLQNTKTGRIGKILSTEDTGIKKTGKKKKKDQQFIWSIKRQFEQSSEFKADMSSLGMKVDVYIDSINRVYEEYLVNFDYFTEQMKLIGFELIDSSMFSDLHQTLLADTNSGRYGKATDMTDAETALSFMNRQFIFKQVKHIPDYIIPKVASVIVDPNKQYKSMVDLRADADLPTLEPAELLEPPTELLEPPTELLEPPIELLEPPEVLAPTVPSKIVKPKLSKTVVKKKRKPRKPRKRKITIVPGPEETFKTS